MFAWIWIDMDLLNFVSMDMGEYMDFKISSMSISSAR